MPGNSFGQAFRLTTFGESHGPAIGAIVDGCPPNISFDYDLLHKDMQRRRPGQSSVVTQRQETDEVEVLSGIFEGKTTGTPIALLIANQDAKSKDYEAIKHLFRPGHADYSYWQKYGLRDHRGSGRASARETAARVAGGAIAKMVLQKLCKATVRSCLVQLGSQEIQIKSWKQVALNPFSCPDPSKVSQLNETINQLRANLDSCGAIIYVEALKIPPGLGEPVFDRLDADLAKALMGINAVKGVEIGVGMASASQLGSEHGDEMLKLGNYATNHAGGILGGISTGQSITARVAFKPTSSIPQPRQSVTTAGKPAKVATKGRHDPCVGLRAPAIVEAMTAIVLTDHLLRQRGQTGLIGGHHS